MQDEKLAPIRPRPRVPARGTPTMDDRPGEAASSMVGTPLAGVLEGCPWTQAKPHFSIMWYNIKSISEP